MKINISKDIDSFNKNSFWKGLSRREVLYGIICIAIGIIGMVKLEPIVGTDAASYIVMLMIIPFALNGFYKKNGMYFGEYIREYRRQNSKGARLTFGSYDREMLYPETIKKKGIVEEAEHEEKE